jgi:drug/metabolite transporter (DMT)-like permease
MARVAARAGAGAVAGTGTATGASGNRGALLGLVGVLAFSLSLPMTRVAVAEIDPALVAFGRMAVAGVVAAAWLLLRRAPLAAAADLRLAAISSLGVVLGFPLLSTLALRSTAANHGAIINGALPLATALWGAAINGERPSSRFWLAAAAGSLLVVSFALLRGGGSLAAGDLWMFAAVAAGSFGYATGARLAARIGGARAILWALAVATPVTVPIALACAWSAPPHAGPAAWGAFAYVTLVSQLLGFFAWYAGLAAGGVARISQLQLLQVFFTITFAALWFGESVAASTWWFAAAVVGVIAWGRSAPRPAVR